MNIAKFVVLGTLDLLGEAGGYDIIRELDRKMVTHWTSVKKGSIYHALKALAKDGHIRETQRVKQGAFPTMTLYRISETGRELFDTLQAQAFAGLFPYYFGFKLALKFNVRLGAEEICAHADTAIREIDRQVDGMTAYADALPKNDPETGDTRFFIDHDLRLLAQERAWIREAANRLKKEGRLKK